MFAKTTRQVNDLIIVALCLIFQVVTHGQAIAKPECSSSWQPASTRTCCDDLFYGKLAKSLAANIHALQKTADQSVQVCDQTISTQSLIDSYSALQVYLALHSPQKNSHYIQDNFTFCRPNPVLITGYYEPVMQASLTKTDRFPVPLYTAPFTEKNQNKFTATRDVIENTDLLTKHAIVYVSDPFTAFTIHIQGSALLTFADGTKRQVHYQRNNGKPYTSIGKVLIDQGLIRREDMSMQAIKEYTENHPQKTSALLQKNKRFIYFTLSEPVTNPTPPSGSFNIPLTPHRSIALDPKLYPQGLLFYLQGTLPVTISTDSNQPQFHRREFGRFVLNQDSGSAIKGHQRVDIFMGRGKRAEIMAGEMQEIGCLRILLPK